MSLSPPIVFIFAASDPSCGAGIQADLLTIASLGCHPLTALTALTIQDTSGIESIQCIDADFLERQARFLLEDISVAAFKIGALGSTNNVVRVAEIIADYPDIPIVLDPVLSSGRGDALADDEMISAICELLLPQTTILTPNILEACRLIEHEDDETEPDSDLCACRLLDYGMPYVLITGTHENTPQVINTLYDHTGPIRRDYWERLPGSYHGSGCTLASAIAACLANGVPIEDAVRTAEEYTWNTLANAFRPGMGQSIPDRLFWARREEEAKDSSI